MIGNAADDPGLFCVGMVREHFYLDGNQKIKLLCFVVLSFYHYICTNKLNIYIYVV